VNVYVVVRTGVYDRGICEVDDVMKWSPE